MPACCASVRSFPDDQVAPTDLCSSPIPTCRRRRSLLQTTDEKLDDIKTSVANLIATQGKLQSVIQTLSTNVDTANMYAKVRANDNTLINLVSAAKTDLMAGQAALSSKLDVIIGKQNQALALAQAQAASLAALTSMTQTFQAAIDSLSAAVDKQLAAILAAGAQGTINLPQALTLFKMARRDEASKMRQFTLANEPCNVQEPQTSNDFKIDNKNKLPDPTARERTIGLNNRVVAGTTPLVVAFAPQRSLPLVPMVLCNCDMQALPHAWRQACMPSGNLPSLANHSAGHCCMRVGWYSRSLFTPCSQACWFTPPAASRRAALPPNST